MHRFPLEHFLCAAVILSLLMLAMTQRFWCLNIRVSLSLIIHVAVLRPFNYLEIKDIGTKKEKLKFKPSCAPYVLKC